MVLSILIQEEEALKLSEERYRLAIEGSNEGVFDYDVEGDNLFISEKDSLSI